MVERPRNRAQRGKDVSGAGSLLAAEVTGTELSYGEEKVDVVATYETLGHGDNGLTQRDFTMMVSRVLGHIA